jgi:hypothetical protein
MRIGDDGGRGETTSGSGEGKGWNMEENLAAAGPVPAPEHDLEEEKEVLEEWRWIMQERGTGRFDVYAGQHVAVLSKVVLGSSLDPDLLRRELAAKHNTSPRRIVTFYVDPW